MIRLTQITKRVHITAIFSKDSCRHCWMSNQWKTKQFWWICIYWICHTVNLLLFYKIGIQKAPILFTNLGLTQPMWHSCPIGIAMIRLTGITKWVHITVIFQRDPRRHCLDVQPMKNQTVLMDFHKLYPSHCHGVNFIVFFSKYKIAIQKVPILLTNFGLTQPMWRSCPIHIAMIRLKRITKWVQITVIFPIDPHRHCLDVHCKRACLCCFAGWLT